MSTEQFTELLAAIEQWKREHPNYTRALEVLEVYKRIKNPKPPTPSQIVNVDTRFPLVDD